MPEIVLQRQKKKRKLLFRKAAVLFLFIARRGLFKAYHVTYTGINSDQIC